MAANPFVGTWRLVSIEGRSKDGSVTYPYGRDPIGYIIYAEDGYMSVGFGSAHRRPFASRDGRAGTVEERLAAYDSYQSYSGRYEISGDHVVHHVEVSSYPNWVGVEQERTFQLEGKRLVLSTPPILIEGRKDTFWLIWERV